jgi:hypothetical protein
MGGPAQSKATWRKKGGGSARAREAVGDVGRHGTDVAAPGCSDSSAHLAGTAGAGREQGKAARARRGVDTTDRRGWGASVA